MSKYQELKALKDKYASQILDIEGVQGVGIRVLENKIVVYCNEITPLTLLSIPIELENVVVDVLGSTGNPTLATWNEETPIPMVNFEGGLKKYRPFPTGVSIGHYAISSGTVGIAMWSRKLNKPVMVSNNHVLADSATQENHPDSQVRNRCRQFTNSKQITISSGGTPYTGNGLIETVTATTKFTWDFNTPIITNISPTTAQAGDIITLTGKSLGFRMGYSKVWFGNQQAKVKSWVSTSNNMIHNYGTYNDDKSFDTDSVIEVYVPSGITGLVDVKIEVEGDPIVQPGRADGGTLLDQVGMLEDYEPLVIYESGMSENDASRGDVAVFSFIDDNIFANKVVAHGGRWIGPTDNRPGYVSPYIGSNYFQSGREYFVNGVQETFCEKLPVMKVGRTTGTTISVIFDPSYSEMKFTYPGYFITKQTIADCVLIYGNHCLQLWDDEGAIPWDAHFLDGGDSGSSYYVASRQDYFDYMQYYNLVHTDEVGNLFSMTNADFDAVEQIVPIQPMNWIGNMFAHWGVIDYASFAYGVGDKAINWMGTLDVYPLGLENPYMQIGTVTSVNTAFLDPNAPIGLYLNIDATAEITCLVEGRRVIDSTLDITSTSVNAISEATVFVTATSASGSTQINIGNINLTPAVIQPSNNITINLEPLDGIHYITGNVAIISETKVIFIAETFNLRGTVNALTSTKIYISCKKETIEFMEKEIPEIRFSESNIPENKFSETNIPETKFIERG